jgi:4-hydroxybenzoate polyprenyltransferase
VRFKERGLLGVLAAAIAQRTLPAVIVFQAMQHWDWTAVAVCVLSTLVGLRYIIVHQIADERLDVKGGVRTLATIRGVSFMRWMMEWVLFPLELVTLAAALVLMSTSLPAVGVLGLLYAAWVFAQLILGSGNPKKLSSTTYETLRDFYCGYWPLLLAVLLASRDAAFFAVLAFTVIWQFRIIRWEVRDLRRSVRQIRSRFAGA